jgi:hypothetical protein
MLLVLGGILWLPSSVYAAATCVVTDNNWGPNAHTLTDGDNTVNVHIQNDGDTNAVGLAFKGDTKITYSGDNSQGESTSYYKANQTETGSFEMIYKVLFSGGGSYDYTLHLTPNGNFTNYAPAIYVGSGYTNPVGHVTDCTVNLHLSHGSSAPAVPATPSLSGTAGVQQNVLNWGNATNATSYKLKRDSTVVYTGAGLSYTDTGLTAGTTYHYTLIATNAGGDSPSSTDVALTPTAPPPPPNTGITTRDINLIGLGVSMLIGYKFIGLFRYRGND